MKKWQSFIGIFFLAILSFSIVPKVTWHECDHAHVEDVDGNGFADADDCSICDYHFSAYSPVQDLQFQAIEPGTTALHGIAKDMPVVIRVNAFSSRGPPAC